MSESSNHQKLVGLIIEYVRERVGENYACFIETDLSDGSPLPQLTDEGFRPDVFFEYNGTLIIGEAKTSDDILREHSCQQYVSYLRKCSLYLGNSEFVIAVPWVDQATANNLLMKIKHDIPGNYNIKVLRGIL